MKTFYVIPILILFISCTGKNRDAGKKEVQKILKEKVVPAFQTLIDSVKVKGTILIFDYNKQQYYSNDFAWAKKGQLPASTFKIANSIIAFETQVVETDHTLFKWDGEPRRLKSWEQDLTLKDAFHVSCVPCYQEIARKIGAKKMNEYLDQLDYGHMQVDSNNIDLFWLQGASRISPFEQIDFLKRFHQSQLAISERTETLMKKMMIIEEKATYQLSGKTGWSISNGKNNGWFVGYVETQNEVYFFATNVAPTAQFDMNDFPMIRKDITYKALEKMKILE